MSERLSAYLYMVAQRSFQNRAFANYDIRVISREIAAILFSHA